MSAVEPKYDRATDKTVISDVKVDFISELPPELSLHILSFLPYHTRALSSIQSREWYVLAQDPLSPSKEARELTSTKFQQMLLDPEKNEEVDSLLKSFAQAPTEIKYYLMGLLHNIVRIKSPDSDDIFVPDTEEMDEDDINDYNELTRLIKENIPTKAKGADLLSPIQIATLFSFLRSITKRQMVSKGKERWTSKYHFRDQIHQAFNRYLFFSAILRKGNINTVRALLNSVEFDKQEIYYLLKDGIRALSDLTGSGIIGSPTHEECLMLLLKAFHDLPLKEIVNQHSNEEAKRDEREFQVTQAARTCNESAEFGWTKAISYLLDFPEYVDNMYTPHQDDSGRNPNIQEIVNRAIQNNHVECLKLFINHEKLTLQDYSSILVDFFKNIKKGFAIDESVGTTGSVHRELLECLLSSPLIKRIPNQTILDILEERKEQKTNHALQLFIQELNPDNINEFTKRAILENAFRSYMTRELETCSQILESPVVQSLSEEEIVNSIVAFSQIPAEDLTLRNTQFRHQFTFLEFDSYESRFTTFINHLYQTNSNTVSQGGWIEIASRICPEVMEAGRRRTNFMANEGGPHHPYRGLLESTPFESITISNLWEINWGGDDTEMRKTEIVTLFALYSLRSCGDFAALASVLHLMNKSFQNITYQDLKEESQSTKKSLKFIFGKFCPYVAGNLIKLPFKLMGKLTPGRVKRIFTKEKI